VLIVPQSPAYRELIASAIHPDLIALNFRQLEGQNALDRLLISDKLSRRNTGALSYGILKRYRHVEAGGWWCNGVDVLNNFQDDSWGQFKPDRPIASQDRGKLIKYEAPPKYPTGIFALKVSDRIWRRIAKRYNIKLYNSLLTLRLQDRITPLVFWEWVLKHPEIPIIITEGSKKAAALLSAGYVAIALPGIFNGYRTPKDEFGRKVGKSSLIPQLQAFARPGREIYFAFDSDNKASTLKNVNLAILKTGKLFEQLECKVKVIKWLSLLGKGADDLIANYGEAAFDAAYNQALPLDQWQTKITTQLTYKANIRVVQRYLNLSESNFVAGVGCGVWGVGEKPISKLLDTSLSVQELQEGQGDLKETATAGEKEQKLRTIPLVGEHCQFDTDSFSIYGADPLHEKIPLHPTPYTPHPTPHTPHPSSSAIPDSAKLICIKSPKGTGKTYMLEQQVARALAAGQWVLVLSHRVQLAEALCVRFGLPYLTEIRSSETGILLGYGLCVDSLHSHSSARFNAQNWHDGIIIIDEAEQVFWHLLNSSTCRKERVAILKSLQTLIQNSLSGNGKVYLLDADLSDLAIDYVRSLAGFHVEPFVIVNDWKPGEREKWDVNLYEDKNPERLIADLVKHIESGGKPMVCCSAQKTKSKWGTQNLFAYLKSKFADKNILTIDSSTVADPEHPAYGCIAHLNEILPKYDIVIASPSIETGVSIDILGHFTSVWAIAQGVQTPDSIRQAMARVRDNVPRHLWAKERGFTGSMVGNGATSYKSLLLSQQKEARANMRLLSHADLISEFDDIELDFQPESLKTWAKRGAAINLSMYSYRSSIVSGLIEEGHNIIKPEAESDALEEMSLSVGQEIAELAQINYQKECQEISDAPDVTDAQLELLKDKRAKTKTERKMERKGELSRRYGIPVTSELVAKDDNGWYPKLQLHYYLTIGKEHLVSRDRSKLKGMAAAGENSLWLPDCNRSLLSVKIKMLELFGIPGLLVENQRFTSSDPMLVSMAELAKQHAPEIKSALNVTIKETDSPIAIAQKFLSLLGMKLKYVGRFGSRSDRERYYQYEPSNDGRESVFFSWLDREELSSALCVQG
jgi:hypothetical protein